VAPAHRAVAAGRGAGAPCHGRASGGMGVAVDVCAAGWRGGIRRPRAARTTTRRSRATSPASSAPCGRSTRRARRRPRGRVPCTRRTSSCARTSSCSPTSSVRPRRRGRRVGRGARRAAPRRAAVWIHGDLSPSNLLLRGGRLTGVLDFSAMGLGDPASDHRVRGTCCHPRPRAVVPRRRRSRRRDVGARRAAGCCCSAGTAAVLRRAQPPLAANARHVIAQLVAERTSR
jgi:hypothetical protein